MSLESIPVDVINPGQVFACLGLLEAADYFAGPARGGFEWPERGEAEFGFTLETAGNEPAIAAVLDFMAQAEVFAVAPDGWAPAKAKNADEIVTHATGFPASEPNETALPILLRGPDSRSVYLGHWTDGSSRDAFKLYSGNRSALSIAQTMIGGKITGSGTVQLKGIAHLWREQHDALLGDPFGVVTPMGGSFNFDARCTWQSIDAGYSPNDHNQDVFGSPVVELLAAWGMEHARPQTQGRRQYSYWIWRDLLQPVLARPALGNSLDAAGQRRFGFTLGLSGKNKVVQYAEEETQ